MLKALLNLVIRARNWLSYTSHLETHRPAKVYVPYDFTKDWKTIP